MTVPDPVTNSHNLLDDENLDAIALLDSEDEYCDDDAFADALLKLKPEWGTQRSDITATLRKFDDAGLLRPKFRWLLPTSYAHFEAQRAGIETGVILTQEEREEAEWLRDAHREFRRHFDDPIQPHPLRINPNTANRLTAGDSELVAPWSDWELEVSSYEIAPGVRRPIQRPIVRSLYAPWQRFRAWTLLETYTLRVLLDPRAINIEEIYRPQWDQNLKGRSLWRRSGSGRPGKILDSLEAAGWLTAVYRVRSFIDWAEKRTHEPSMVRWDAGLALSVDERWKSERSRLQRRCLAIAEPWCDTLAEAPGALGQTTMGVLPSAFRQRMMEMVELWRWATDAGQLRLATALHDDVRTVTEWALFAFNTTFEEVNRSVGSINEPEETNLEAVLRPDRARATRIVRQHMSYLFESYNKHIAQPKFTHSDGWDFLDYLERNELWAWTSDLAAYLTVDERTADSNRDQRFLYLRSLALFCEPILMSLADQFGTDADRAKMHSGTVKGPLKAFLADRRDWRHEVWQAVSLNYATTETRGGGTDTAPQARGHAAVGELLTEKLDAIEALVLPAEVAGAAKQILALAAMRNFGAHRFSRDARMLHEYGGHIAGAAIFCPMFYWKIATTMC
jgi:hypothetical protein